ncbi:MAG TPA: glycosyl hydrolase [Chitinophagaceae bacterium]|nr:glycosyl hydrolase [Chitinophagaceae bacterium]
MRIRVFFLVSLLFFAIATHAQIKWPAVTRTMKPWTRWWWQGSAVDKPNLTASMQLYQQAGLGGLEITPIYGVGGHEKKFIDYLSPQWIEMLGHTLKEGKRLNLGIDMATGTGWPFGGGPLIGAEEACRNFLFKKFNLKAGEVLKDTIIYIQEPMVRAVGNLIHEMHGIYKVEEPKGTISEPLVKPGAKLPAITDLVEPVFTNKNLQALALDQVKFIKPLPLQTLMAYSDKGEIVELTNKVDGKGKLTWTAPATGGNWELVALFMGWHGKMVERAAPGDEGNVIDHFSASNLKKYLGWFDKSFRRFDLSGLRGFFNDSYEVDDARGQSNWTGDFFNEFKRRRGYDLKNYIPALIKEQKDEQSWRVLYDFRQTIADMLLDNFTKPWHDWAKSKGKIVRNQSHGSPANILDLYAAVDIPETEGTNLTRFKFATSSAHVMGKPLASAEAATWLNEHFLSSLGDVKLILDKYFLGGVNHIFYHGTNYSPQNEPWPGWLFYAAVHFTPANPFWKDFGTLNAYAARCQSFLQAGKPDNDVLLYFPFSDRNYLPARGGLLHHYDGMEGFDETPFKESAEKMLEMGYSWDLISDKQIEQLNFVNGKIKAPGGNYQTIVLSGVKYLPLATLQKLIALTKAGAQIIFHDGAPKVVPGLSDIENKQKQFDALIAQLQFKTTNAPGVNNAASGKGLFLEGNELRYLLANAAIRHEMYLTDNKLQFIRRKINGGEYYFITNDGKTTFNDWVLLNTKLQHAVLFDPMQQRSGIAKTRQGDNNTLDIFLQLAPGESCIVQTSSAKLTGNKFPYTESAGEAVAIEGNWQLKFLSGGPVLPQATAVSNLLSWTALAADGVKEFSGTAQYSINFKKPATNADAWLLNLSDVKESATILLNGKKIATLIGPSYAVTIPEATLKPDNQLVIIVTNGMANRIIDLEKRGVQWKKFYNVNMPARLAENRGTDGLFTAVKWQPKASGLIGPVNITPLKFMR